MLYHRYVKPYMRDGWLLARHFTDSWWWVCWTVPVPESTAWSKGYFLCFHLPVFPAKTIQNHPKPIFTQVSDFHGVLQLLATHFQLSLGRRDANIGAAIHKNNLKMSILLGYNTSLMSFASYFWDCFLCQLVFSQGHLHHVRNHLRGVMANVCATRDRGGGRGLLHLLRGLHRLRGLRSIWDV